MFLSFFLFQAFLRMLSGPERIITRAFEQINIQLDPLQRMAIGPVFQQLDKLLGAEVLKMNFKDEHRTSNVQRPTSNDKK